MLYFVVLSSYPDRHLSLTKAHSHEQFELGDATKSVLCRANT